MNFDELKSRDIKDLRILASQYGIKFGPRSKPETIAKLIFEFVANKPKQEMQHPAEKPKEPMVIHTEEEIRTALKTVLEKPHFTITFPGDNTVMLKGRGIEESIHMSAPLRVINSKAQGVSRGALMPRGFQDQKLNPTVNSGLVLMV